VRALRNRVTTADDSGFTLVEVVVAMVIFVVMAGSVLGLLVRISGTTADNIRRTAAANLASRQIESLQKLGKAEIIGLPTTSTSTATVGNIVYTIKQDVTPADKDSAASICVAPGSGSPDTKVSFSRVNVSVTWAAMGRTAPVKAQTLLSLGAGTEYAVSGLPAAVTVTGPDSTLPNIPVTLVRQGTPSDTKTETTDSAGCATFVGLSSGQYDGSANSAGYVGLANLQSTPLDNPVDTTTVSLPRVNLTYAKARSLDVTWTAPAGATIATGIPLRIGRNSPILAEYTLGTCPGVVIGSCTSGFPGTVQALYPATYQIKAGACTDSSNPTKAVDVSGNPLNVATVNLPLGAISVTVKNLLGVPITGRAVTFTHAAASGCASGETYTATTGATGTVLGLPYGTWTVSTTTGPAPAPSPTPVPTGPTPSPTPAPTSVLSKVATVSAGADSTTVDLLVLS
jgi:prepilin-type N-terminal cleavage/methylation domain-containing protein